MADARIVGRFLAVVADTVADADESPDFVPLQGSITLTPSVSAILVGGEAPATHLMTPIVAPLDDEGYVSLHNLRGVSVLAPDASTNPTGWTYKVTPALSLNGKLIPYGSWSIAVTPGETVDLTLSAPVPEAKGTAITQGVGVQSARSYNGELILTLSNGYDLEPITLPVGPKGDKGDVGVSLIPEVSGNTGINSYPDGISIMEITTTVGWPASWAAVETVKYSGPHRAWQTLVERNTGKSWRRTPGSATNTWNAWIEWGAQGPPGQELSLTAGTVTTLAAGSNATATITGTFPNRVLQLGVPRGATGATGAPGSLGVHVGTTPPADTTKFWIDTSA